MTKRTQTAQYFQAALVLHTRPYRNTSMLVDFFCESSGVLRCVAKGYRSVKAKQGISQFCLYRIRFSGKGDLKTLLDIEPEGPPVLLERENLFCAFYVNELLLRVLYHYDPHPELFQLSCDLYRRLSRCGTHEMREQVLRAFEFSLLADIGYLVDMKHDYSTGERIEKNARYRFDSQQGFCKVDGCGVLPDMNFSGATIIALAQRDFTGFANDDEAGSLFRKESKALSRLMLAPCLGDKPLQSRQLFDVLKPTK